MTRNKALSTLLPVLSLFVLLAVTEVVLRTIYAEEDIDGTYFGRGAFEAANPGGYIHQPGFNGFMSRRDVFRVPVAINPLGMREPDVRARMQSPTRVLVLGDSFTFGVGVNVEDAYPTLAANALRSSGVGVINAGQIGYGIEQSAYLAASLIPEVNPQVVIVQLFPLNDIRDDFERRYRTVAVHDGLLLPGDRFAPLLDFVRVNSYLWRFVRARLNRGKNERLRNEFNAQASADPEAVSRNSCVALERLITNLQDRRIAVGVMMVPRGHSGGTIFDGYLRAVCEKKGVPVLDLGTQGLTPDDYIKGDGHWNEAGHRKAGQLVTRLIATVVNER